MDTITHLVNTFTDIADNHRSEYLAFGKPDFGEEEIEAVAKVLRSGWIGMGSETLVFEDELAKYVGAKYVVTVNSCTSALFLSLLVSGVRPGDEVICPSLTWYSTANAALYLGATPVFCDVDKDSLTITPETVLPLITSRTKAVIAVHMGGLSVDVSTLKNVLPAHVTLIEDAAHALGSSYPNHKPVGSSGNLVCFSFYANKNLSTGEGGAIALFDEKLADKLRMLRQNGLHSDAWKRYINPKNAITPGVEELGYKMNYTDLQSCIGRVQLRRQQDFNAKRTAIANVYLDVIKNRLPSLSTQSGIDTSYHSKHLFVIMLPIETMQMSRTELLYALRKHNIGASIHYSPLHLMPLYKEVARSSALKYTENLAERIMTLPISVCMTTDDASYVMEVLERIIRIT